MAQSDLSQQQQDEALLQKFGYKQELRRSLGFISNFAVAFSYISVSTGTFSLFYLGILAGGPAFFWTWFIVAIGQFIVALNSLHTSRLLVQSTSGVSACLALPWAGLQGGFTFSQEYSPSQEWRLPSLFLC
jgi:hypothetical protein